MAVEVGTSLSARRANLEGATISTNPTILYPFIDVDKEFSTYEYFFGMGNQLLQCNRLGGFDMQPQHASGTGVTYDTFNYSDIVASDVTSAYSAAKQKFATVFASGNYGQGIKTPFFEGDNTTVTVCFRYPSDAGTSSGGAVPTGHRKMIMGNLGHEGLFGSGFRLFIDDVGSIKLTIGEFDSTFHQQNGPNPGVSSTHTVHSHSFQTLQEKRGKFIWIAISMSPSTVLVYSSLNPAEGLPFSSNVLGVSGLRGPNNFEGSDFSSARRIMLGNTGENNNSLWGGSRKIEIAYFSLKEDFTGNTVNGLPPTQWFSKVRNKLNNRNINIQ